MMHFLSLHDNPTLEAQLTERMLQHILIADPFPRSSITLLCPWISPILLILTVHLALVFRTISPFRKVGTARISARLLRFSRHLSTFFLPRKKPLQFFPATASSSFAFAILTLSHRLTVSNLILLYSFRNLDFIQGIPMKAEYIVDTVTKFDCNLFPSHIGQVPQFQYCLKFRTLHGFDPADPL